MLVFEYEEGITTLEKEVLKTYEDLLKSNPEMKIKELMNILGVYKSSRDLGTKYRIGSGHNHIFVCRNNKNFDRILLVVEDSD
jgi:hypothetical protein